MAVEKVGTRVRKFREAQDMTLEKLSDATGLGVDFLRTLEEDSVYPSIGPLQKIARALNVRLGTFMDDVTCQDPIITRQAARDADLTMKQTAAKRPSYRYFTLAKGKVDRNMEPFFIEVMPEAEGDRKLSSHQGEEFIIVHSGRLLLRYGSEEQILEPGDSVYYNSIVPHYVGAYGDEPCTIYAVLYHPS
ncbi:XRE family transcriptional regulator [Desulfovibrio sp. OttesenSCG-928-G11]|nr:XRE family transcriptional regulator [Desulfovibrio sp. OttesenSCG-928-G11]